MRVRGITLAPAGSVIRRSGGWITCGATVPQIQPEQIGGDIGINDFEPQIIAFLCNWCAYTGVDLSSGSRMEYPPNVRIIRMMCSGAVDPLYVIKTLLDGVDGVLIGGCHLGDCHYQSGNYKARQQVDILRNILSQVGLGEDRIWVRWFSAAEGPLFADTVTEMVEHLKEKGPSPLKELWAV